NQVRFRAHLGLHEDETSALCHWHVPEAHFLESWGDARAHDGTVSIIQPLIAPLHGGKSVSELLALLTESSERSSYDLVRDYWRQHADAGDFESWWRKTVHDGFAAGTQVPARTVTLLESWRQEMPRPGDG